MFNLGITDVLGDLTDGEFPIIFKCGCEGIYDAVNQRWSDRYSAACPAKIFHANWWEL